MTIKVLYIGITFSDQTCRLPVTSSRDTNNIKSRTKAELICAQSVIRLQLPYQFRYWTSINIIFNLNLPAIF